MLLMAIVGCGRQRARVAKVADAGAVTGTVDASAPARAFVTGTVVVAARHDGHVRPFRLDPASGRWQALGSGADHLFPTEAADGDAVLVIATRGEHEGEHVERLAWVRGAAVAPFGPGAASIRNPTRAGATIVFESSARSFRDVYRVDGTAIAAEPRRLTDDSAGNFEPALSPDGAAVVFTSSRDGDAELYRIATRGGRATRLTASARDDWGARWSPDGGRLVFLSDREGAPRAFVMDADGTDLRRLTAETDPAVVEDAPRWSPDGATIALLRGTPGAGAVVLADARGPGADQRPRVLTPADASDTEATWSPDGAYLLIARHQPPAAAAAITFVRIADNMAMAAGPGDPPDPLALRWYPK